MPQDIRFTRRWQQARALARARDGDQCVRCASTHRLSVHHRTPLARGGDPYDLANLETLCSRCHARADATLRRAYRQGGVSRTAPAYIPRSPVPRAPSGSTNRFSTVVVR